MYRLIDFRPVDAHKWRKNGDHPNDDSVDLQSSDGPFLTEGEVVRRFAHPDMNSEHYCSKCGNKAKTHGWIDRGSVGITVCPGDWVVSMGPEYLVLSDSSFQRLFYSTISGGVPPVPMQAVSYSSDKPVKPRVASVRPAWEETDTVVGLAYAQETTKTDSDWCRDCAHDGVAMAPNDEPMLQEPKGMDQNKNEAFELDKIVAEFDMHYTEIANNVMACALVHEGAKFSVTGLASCLDPDSYDMKAAKEHAYNDAAGKVHQFEQYRKNMNAHLQKAGESVVPPVSTPMALPETFDIGTARRLILDGKKVAHKDWNGSDAFVFYVPPGKYPASRNGNGTLLGLYPDDMVPYDGYLAVKMGSGNVVPWHPTIYDILNAGWYLVEDKTKVRQAP